MANQSNLAIGGIGADPSGSHPTGQLDRYWRETVDNASVKYSAAQGLDLFEDNDIEALLAGAVGTYYSKPLKVSFSPGLKVDIGDTGNAECEAGAQWYNSKDDFISGAPGSASSSTGGEWLGWHSPAQNYQAAMISPFENTDDDIMHKGSQIRIAVVITSAGGSSVSDIQDYLDEVSGSMYVWKPIDMEAEFNQPLSSIGGIGADPS